jgi:hypothetical protein
MKNSTAKIGVLLAFLFWQPAVALAQSAPAPLKVAVCQLRNGANVSEADAAKLTKLVRARASRTLPAARYTVMTNGAIAAALPPGTNLTRKIDSVPRETTVARRIGAPAPSEVEVGRAIGADYMLTVDLLTYAAQLRVVLRAHDCKRGSFLGMETVKGKKLSSLDRAIENAADSLFKAVANHDVLPAIGLLPGAPQRVSVLDLHHDANVSDSAAAYLSDLVRGKAGQLLPSTQFTILTHEYTMALQPPSAGPGIGGADLGDGGAAPGAGASEPKKGRDYVVAGEIRSVAGQYSAVLNAHDKKGGGVLGERTVKSKDLLTLEKALPEAAESLFTLVKNQGN